MSEITEWFPTEECHGDTMPWYGCVIEGNRWLILPGMTGRGPDMKQEYPELIEKDDFHSDDQARLVTCPHSIEEQTELILTKIKSALDSHDTGFENVFNTDYFLTDRALWPAMFRTMKKWMGQGVLGVLRTPDTQRALDRARSRSSGHADRDTDVGGAAGVTRRTWHSGRPAARVPGLSRQTLQGLNPPSWR